MHASLFLLAPLALLAPLPGGASPSSDADTALLPPVERIESAQGEALDTIEAAAVPAAQQVRIEQRVVIRIAPASSSMRPAMFAEMPQMSVPPRLTERKMGKCVPVAGIAAVRPDAGGRLLLFMRDRRLISASLEKACNARDFYSGFYVERSKDGMLCVDRDKLHSRAGANCELGRMRQLVAVSD